MSDFKLLDRSASHRLTVLKANTVLRAASPESLELMAEKAQPLRLRKGAILWSEGERADAIACVVQGSLLVQKSDRVGRVAYLQLKKSGELLGHSAISLLPPDPSTPPDPRIHHATILAREETVLLLVPGAAFQQLLGRESRLNAYLIRELSESLRFFMEDAFMERVLPGRQLLAAKLLALADMEGVQQRDQMDLRYSQAELSRFMSLGARNINKFLSELPAIRTLPGRKGLRIDSLSALRAFVNTASLASEEDSE